MTAPLLRRIALALALGLGACASTPTRLSVETDAAEAVSAAKHVAYWMEIDLRNVRHPDEATAAEIARLKASAARLSAQAETLEEELEQATRARVDQKSTDFTSRGPLATRSLKEQTIQVRTQWEAFLRTLAAKDAAERPGTVIVPGVGPGTGDGTGAGTGLGTGSGSSGAAGDRAGSFGGS